MTAYKTIELDGSGWKDAQAFLRALRTAIGSPEWHGWSPNAFIDSMIWGGINALEAPYVIVVTGSERAPAEVVEYIDLISRILAEAAIEHSTEDGEPVPAGIFRSLP